MSSFKPIYKLRSWVPIEYLDWAQLSANENAIDLLESIK